MAETMPQSSSLNIFELLPPVIIVNLFRESVSLPLDRYADLNRRQLSKVLLFYNINADTRDNVLYEIRLKSLHIKRMIPYQFKCSYNVNGFSKARLWKQELVNFIATTDFGPVNPLDINSPPLTSYFCIIGGENSSCPGEPTYIAPSALITSLFSIYIRRNNLFRLATSNIERLRDGKQITTKYFSADKAISELFTPFLTQLPYVDINNMTHVDTSRIVRLMFERDFFTQTEIDAVNAQLNANIPADEEEVFSHFKNIQENDLISQHQAARNIYRSRWRGTSLEERTEPPPIEVISYDMNDVLRNVERAVGHELSSITLACSARYNEMNIAMNANLIGQNMLRYSHFYQ